MFRVCLYAALLADPCLFIPRLSEAQGLDAPPAVQSGVQQALALTASADTSFPPAMQGLIEHAKALAAAPYTSSAHVQQLVPRDAIQQTGVLGLPTIAFTEPLPPSTASPAQMIASDFSQTMDALGAQITPSLVQRLTRLEGSEADAKVALIAWYRRQHPQLYQELDQRYLRHMGDPLKHVNHSPGVLAGHATEKYRLAWEYLLLEPAVGATELYDIRATDALQRIGNDASLTTYRLVCAISADPKINADAAKYQQKLLLGSLACFRDQKALLTILACMGLSPRQMVNQPQVWDPADEVKGLLASSFKKTEMDRWRPTVRAALSLNLLAEQKAFLNPVLRVTPQPLEQPSGITTPTQ